MPLPAMGEQAGARILIIDDEPMSIQVMSRILARAGIVDVCGVSDSRVAEQEFRRFEPDLVLLDLRMPGLDGLEVLERLVAATPRSTYLPIVMLTAEDSTDLRQQALTRGARDFLGKPFDMNEVLLRIRNLLETRALHLALEDQNRQLEARVDERTRELEQAQLEVLQRLARAGELRDDDTGQHTYRVAALSAALARGAGLSDSDAELLLRVAPLHDVGKIGIPDAILLKQGPLTPQEFEIIKSHTTIGASMLANGRSAPIRMAEAIALSHHERWEGGGYPHGLAGEAIPLAARVVAIADVFDALTHARPYRPAWSVTATLQEIERLRGGQLDPVLVDAFLGLEPHSSFC